MSKLQSSLSPVAQTPPQLFCQLTAAGWAMPALSRVRAASMHVVVETSHLLRGSGKPFSCHLIGVASLVAEATDDADLTVAALLHAITQVRVVGGNVTDAITAAMENVSRHHADSERVVALLHAYCALTELEPHTPVLIAAEGQACDLRILQLADRLEDGLDGDPWWHGAETDTKDTRGGALSRVSRLEALAPHYAMTPVLGAPMLLTRYEATMATLLNGNWPSILRSGLYTSHPVAKDVGA